MNSNAKNVFLHIFLDVGDLYSNLNGIGSNLGITYKTSAKQTK